MSKKLITVAIVIVLTMSLFVVFAQDNVCYEAYESAAKIFSNGEEVNFDLPVITINGNTYIPLREAAEKADMDVEWNGENNSITLTEDMKRLKNTFDGIFDFALPETAKIISYNYYIDFGEPHYAAKISIDAEDLNYIESNFGKNDLDSPDDLEKILEENPRPAWKSQEYTWWKMSDIAQSIYVRQGITSGFNGQKSVYTWASITESTDGQYYLYVFFN